MINETFEEQQKQSQLYASNDLKELFYNILPDNFNMVEVRFS